MTLIAGGAQYGYGSRSSQSIAPSIAATAGYSAHREEPESPLDPVLRRMGAQIRGRIRGSDDQTKQLDPEYKIRRPGKKFFTVGRVSCHIFNF